MTTLTQWIHEAAMLNPGICFTGIMGNTMWSFEVPSDVHDDWLQDVEIGMKDGAQGCYRWDEDLNRYTKVEETP